jgi:WD repeat-containing protein 1 (actin-interacting protein 1)
MAAASGAGGDDTPKWGTHGGLLVPNPRTTRGEPTVIDSSKDGKYVIYCNGSTVIVRDVEVCDSCFDKIPRKSRHARAAPFWFPHPRMTHSTSPLTALQDPSKCFSYSEHAHEVRVAKFSPNGKYIASGDVSGRLRTWAWTHPKNLLKNEAMVFGGAIEDLSWDGEGKRILCVGAGQT